MHLIDNIRFDASFSFVYSKRPVRRRRTCRMKPPAAKLARLARCKRRSTKTRAHQSSHGRFDPRVVVEPVEKNAAELMFAPRTSHRQFFRWTQRDALVGEMLDVRITQALRHTLRGNFAVWTGSDGVRRTAATATKNAL